MKILILFATLIFSLTTFAETQADWFSPGCAACAAMQKNNAKLGNSHGVCNTRGCGKGKGKGANGTPASATAPVSK